MHEQIVKYFFNALSDTENITYILDNTTSFIITCSQITYKSVKYKNVKNRFVPHKCKIDVNCIKEFYRIKALFKFNFIFIFTGQTLSYGICMCLCVHKYKNVLYIMDNTRGYSHKNL